MTEQLNQAQAEPVEMTPEQAAKLAEVARRLETDGEVYVQTDENVGNEEPTPTVH